MPAGLTGVTQIAIGGDHMVALKSDGTVVCWGSNGSGESTVPAGLSEVVQVTAGQTHTVALKSNGTVVCWGDNSYGQLAGAPTGGVVQIVAGTNHTLAMKANGGVYGWGYDWETGATSIPTGLTDVIQIYASTDASFALLSNGTMVKWGNDDFPVYPTLTDIVQVSGTYVLKSNGTVEDWSTSTIVPGISGVVQIDSSEGGPLIALKANGSVVCYGDDATGFNTYGENQPPVDLEDTTGVSIGYDSMAVRKSNGTAFFFGSANKFGESIMPTGLTGIADIQTNGALVLAPDGQSFTLTAHSAALKSTGTVACWGDNRFGQNDIPAGLANVVQISVGFGHTAARLADGKVVCWGYNDAGQCTVPANLPAVQELPPVDFIPLR